jgi:hypothetical protein
MFWTFALHIFSQKKINIFISQIDSSNWINSKIELKKVLSLERLKKLSETTAELHSFKYKFSFFTDQIKVSDLCLLEHLEPWGLSTELKGF